MRKGQNLAFAVFTFAIIFVVFFELFVSQFEGLKEVEDVSDELSEDVERIADQLAGESLPYQWSSIDEVKKMGLIINATIHNGTLDEFDTLSYYRSKLLLGARSDYIFFFTSNNETLVVDNNQYWGYSKAKSGNGGSDLTTFFQDILKNSTNIAKAERFVRFDESNFSRMALLTVYVWE